MNKQWIYRNGEKPFSVTEIIAPGGYVQYVSMSIDNQMRNHLTDGKTYIGCCGYDIIPYEPYIDYEINDQVYGRHIENEKTTAGHFAGLNSDGKPTTFHNGGTSFTRHSLSVDTWSFCEKIEPAIEPTTIKHNRRSMDQ